MLLLLLLSLDAYALLKVYQHEHFIAKVFGTRADQLKSPWRPEATQPAQAVLHTDRLKEGPKDEGTLHV